MRKIKILLDAIERMGRDIEYYALDLSLSELERTLSKIPTGTYTHVKCFGLHGTYDDGLVWIRSADRHTKPKCILFLGSSIGNFPRSEAANFLKQFTQVLQPKDSIIIGVDSCKDSDKVYRAYNDVGGVTHRFILNGLSQANVIIGRDVFHEKDWKVVGEYDEEAGRHQAFYVPLKDVSFENIIIKAGEKVRIEESYKYSADERSRLWATVGLSERAHWANAQGNYRKFALSQDCKGYCCTNHQDKPRIHDVICAQIAFFDLPSTLAPRACSNDLQ